MVVFEPRVSLQNLLAVAMATTPHAKRIKLGWNNVTLLLTPSWRPFIGTHDLPN